MLGNGTTADSAGPVPVIGLTAGVTAIAAGGDHSCAIAKGAVWCWGRNEAGQLGTDTTDQDAHPVRVLVSGPSGR
jgi:alpha-tubulin suppressor-like RCC1 family protein